MSPSVAITSLIAFAALALTACAESPIVEPEAGVTAARATRGTSSRAAAPSRPAGGTCTLTSRPEVLPPLAGQPANVVRRRTEWVCQLQHLGNTMATATETGTVLEGGSSVAGTAVFTAANGDQLVTTFSGMATFPDQNGIVTFDGTDTVTGGTGRFAGASGSFTRATRVNVFLGSGQLVLDGTLSY